MGPCILPQGTQFYKGFLFCSVALSPPFSKLGAKVPISEHCIFELCKETVQGSDKSRDSGYTGLGGVPAVPFSMCVGTRDESFLAISFSSAKQDC